MLRLEACWDLLKISDRSLAPEQAVELANDTFWVLTMARQQRQAEKDL